ncbi:Melanoma-associated antigen 10 [Tupaia chinensis]|uniref:Melanoma-associated antigen 10 n=2 Tax=Tupaia chinensis TaxID=246437 RepID=L9J8M0_TUPCH|nr:Melanoma-associated antigen 10 [Tupaia chinensis]
MLEVVIKTYNNHFPVIFTRACRCLDVIFGIDVNEMDPTTHSYVLVNSLDVTYDDMVGDYQSMPKNGLLVMILGLIFIEGNHASEEDIWGFLNMMGMYPGREHYIYGDPSEFTRDWVQENYLEYRQMPNSDPPRYEFLWGPRAYAETSKVNVLKYMAKVKGDDFILFSGWYEQALRDDEKRAQSKIGPMVNTAAQYIAQHCPEASPDSNEG